METLAPLARRAPCEVRLRGRDPGGLGLWTTSCFVVCNAAKFETVNRGFGLFLNSHVNKSSIDVVEIGLVDKRHGGVLS